MRSTCTPLYRFFDLVVVTHFAVASVPYGHPGYRSRSTRMSGHDKPESPVTIDQNTHKALQDLEPRLLAYIQRHADWQAVVQWRIQAASTKLYNNVSQAFSLVNLRRLCTALGRERVLGLFVDVAKIRDAVRVYKEKSRVDCGNQVLQST